LNFIELLQLKSVVHPQLQVVNYRKQLYRGMGQVIVYSEVNTSKWIVQVRSLA
jgi:hypothetical protein